MAAGADQRPALDRERVDVNVRLHLPTATVVKVLLTLIVVWAGLRLWPQFVLLLLISLLIAVAAVVDAVLQGEKHPWEGPTGRRTLTG